MNNYKYIFLKALGKLLHKDLIVSYYRKQGMNIKTNVHIFSNIITSEPYLIYIDENSTLSTNVSLVTHDAAIGCLLGREKASDLCGRIHIGKDCFIGLNAIVMYGVTLGDRTIVAAGAVVTKSFPQGNVILAGNPAKVICSSDYFLEKYKDSFFCLHGLDFKSRKIVIEQSCEKLIERKVGKNDKQ